MIKCVAEKGYYKRRLAHRKFKMKKIRRGDYYIDCGLVPRICVDNNGESLAGISLVDGEIGNCSIRYCRPRKVTKKTAINTRLFGPRLKKDRERLKKFYESGEWGSDKVWWE